MEQCIHERYKTLSYLTNNSSRANTSVTDVFPLLMRLRGYALCCEFQCSHCIGLLSEGGILRFFLDPACGAPFSGVGVGAEGEGEGSEGRLTKMGRARRYKHIREKLAEGQANTACLTDRVVCPPP